MGGKVWGPLPGAELTVVLESAHPPTSHQPVIELPKMVFHVADTWKITQKYPNTQTNKLTNSQIHSHSTHQPPTSQSLNFQRWFSMLRTRGKLHKNTQIHKLTN